MAKKNPGREYQKYVKAQMSAGKTLKQARSAWKAAKKAGKVGKVAKKAKKPAKAAAPAKKPVKKHVKVTKAQYDAAVKHVLTHLHTIARYHGATHKEARFFTNLVHKHFQDLLKDLAVLVTSRRATHAARLRAHAKKVGKAAVTAGVKAAKKAVAAGASPSKVEDAAERAVREALERDKWKSAPSFGGFRSA